MLKYFPAFFHYEGGDLYLNKNESNLYSDKLSSTELNSFFNPFETKESNITNVLENIGGVSSKKTLVPSKGFLRIMPSYINAVKGRIIFNDKTRHTLQEIKPNTDNVVLGIVIDLNKIKITNNIDKITMKEIKKYIDSYDAIPLLYNSDEGREMVYRTHKSLFFSKNSKLCLVTFEVKPGFSFYTEVPTKESLSEFRSIGKIVKTKKRLVSHFIFNDYFFLMMSPENNLKIIKCELIDVQGSKIKFEPTTDFEYEANNRQLTVAEISKVIIESRKKLTHFTVL